MRRQLTLYKELRFLLEGPKLSRLFIRIGGDLICIWLIIRLEMPISQMFPRPGVQRDIQRMKRVFFCDNNVELPLVLNSLNMKRFLTYMISKLTEWEVAARSLLPRPGGPIFSPYRPSKRGIFIIWLTTFKYERSQKQTLLYLQIHNTRVRLRVNIHKEFTVTVHNFHQFEKVEWIKLKRTEIKARKYVK